MAGTGGTASAVEGVVGRASSSIGHVEIALLRPQPPEAGRATKLTEFLDVRPRSAGTVSNGLFTGLYANESTSETGAATTLYASFSLPPPNGDTARSRSAIRVS